MGISLVVFASRFAKSDMEFARTRFESCRACQKATDACIGGFLARPRGLMAKTVLKETCCCVYYEKMIVYNNHTDKLEFDKEESQ